MESNTTGDRNIDLVDEMLSACIQRYHDMETDPVLKDSAKVVLAWCLVSNGRMEDALNVLQKCTVDIPSVLRQRAVAYQLLGQFNSAYKWWKKAGYAGVMLGSCLVSMKRMTEALKLCKNLERSGQTTPMLYSLLEEIYESRGNIKQADKYNKLFMENPQILDGLRISHKS